MIIRKDQRLGASDREPPFCSTHQNSSTSANRKQMVPNEQPPPGWSFSNLYTLLEESKLNHTLGSTEPSIKGAVNLLIFMNLIVYQTPQEFQIYIWEATAYNNEKI